MNTPDKDAWANAPEHPDFARRVLDSMPAPVLVVDATATIIYANAALLALTGRTGQSPDDDNVLDYVHPDDVAWLAEAFVEVSQSDPEQDRGDLPSTHVRLLAPNGETIPVEVTGAKTISDDIIGGVVYDVRPARHHDLLAHLVAGISSGADLVDLLRLVTQLIAMPPLTLDAAVLERVDGDWSVVTSTSTTLTDALGAIEAAAFNAVTREPHRCDALEMGEDLLSHIIDVGYADTWRLSVPVPDDGRSEPSRYEIIACNTVLQDLSPAVMDRMSQARELAQIVMMRSENDRLMHHAASHDSLTGLLNRSAFREHLATTPNDETGSTVLFLDLDDFKDVNDQHGHVVGDAVLTVVAERLSSTVRHGDVVARLGGDEFAIILHGHADPNDGQPSIPHRLIERVSAPISVSGANAPIYITASAGISPLRSNDSVDAALSRADALMYEAKRSGGHRAQFDRVAV